jgi:hypothetical protein
VFLKKIHGSLLASLAAALLVGCAPVIHKPLEEQTHTRVKDVEIRAVVVQEGPIFSARAPGISVATGGGLIPALIDASIQQSRQKELNAKIREMLDAVDGYDFRADYAASLAQLVQNTPYKVSKQEVTSLALQRSDLDAKIAGTKEGKAFLLLLTHYELEPNLSALSIRTSASLWIDGAQEKVYSNNLIFQAPTGSGGLSQHAEIWAASNGKFFREQSRLGLQETMRMLAMDIKARRTTGKSDTGMEPKSSYNVNVAGIVQPLLATKVTADAGRVVVRDKDGALFSLPQ